MKRIFKIFGWGSQEMKKTDSFENDQIFPIEEIFAKLPHLSENIFGRLDDRSLVSCREVSKTWQGYVDSQRIYWIRQIIKCNPPQSKFHGEWKKVLDKTPIEILKEFARLVGSRPPHIEYSPLHIAGIIGDVELFKSIQQKTGLNENSESNTSGMTAFHPRNSLGFTPLHYAAHHGHVNICQLICEKIIGTGLHLRSSSPVKMVYGPESNSGFTPLHFAACFGHVEVCKFLCLNLEEKNPRNKYGLTPLHIAAEKGHLDVCEFLCSNLQDKNPKCDDEKTPMDLAYSNKHWKIVHFLIEENNLA